MIDKMIAWVDEVPPVKQPMRFGNKAFRTWHARVRATEVAKHPGSFEVDVAELYEVRAPQPPAT